MNQTGRDKPRQGAVMMEKILVVDDEKHIRMLYREELETEGYKVVTSDGSGDILDVIAAERPSIILLDIKLGPHTSGLDLLQAIRTSDANIPVILSTAYDTFQNDLKSIAADDYVVKSVDLSVLKGKVRAALDRVSA